MARERFDVVIVGGGAAGCVLARRIAEAPGHPSVLLLEAGPDIRGAVPRALRAGWDLPRGRDWPFDWGFDSEPSPERAAEPLRRGRVLGGTSWLTRFAVRGAVADFDALAAAGNEGWTYEDVLPAFRRLERDLDFGDRPWHGSSGPLSVTRYPELPRSAIHQAALEGLQRLGFPAVPDHNAPGAVGVGPLPMSGVEGERISAVDAWLPPDQQPPGLVIRADALVDRVLLRDGGATGVRLADRTVIDAGEVVLAAGTYGSPSILMRSGIGPAAHLVEAGVPVAIDLPGVGSNLADHPGIDLDSGCRGKEPGDVALQSIATFRSSHAPVDGAPDLMFWLTDPDGPDGRLYVDPILLKPEARGSVRLRTPDPVDAPRIVLPSPTADDLERLREGYEIGLEVVSGAVLRGFASEPAPSWPARRDEQIRTLIERSYSIPHVVGTCAMGASPAAGAVVDARGRVHGISGLRVIDASILPNPPTGFPHLITLMLAEHLAPTIL